jgi:hypothetical protein
MKKFLLFFLGTFFIASFVQAQIAKGSILLGGGISGYKNKSVNGNLETENKGISISPSAGIAVKENSVLGIKAAYSHAKYEPGPGQKNYGYAGGLFFRRYLSLSKSFYLFGEAGAEYGYSKIEYTVVDTKSVMKNRGFSLDLFPGIAYAVSNRFHLEASLNNLVFISYGKISNDQISPGNVAHQENSSISFSSSAGSANPLSIGFRFVIAK